jgi:hypothetical protein
MKAIKVTVLIAMLATGFLLVNFPSIEAKKANTNDRLTVKSYGPKSDHKISVAKAYDDKSDSPKPFTKKPEEIKTKLKLIEAQKALELAKKIYRG